MTPSNKNEHITDTSGQLTPLQQAAVALKEMRLRLNHLEQARTEPIAIVGMGCRFPGGASSPEALWDLLRKGVDTISDVPADRWEIEKYYDPDPTALGKTYSRWGGFLSDIDQFDPYFFGISPREAESMDPQQRLLLEVSWEALENAGQVPDKLMGSQTGVFVGILSTEYLRAILPFGQTDQIDTYMTTGNAFSVAAGRLSYVLGLQGPCMAIDTACSSSLVAVHMACQSLRNSECTMAIAGGVNVVLSPEVTIGFSKGRILAMDGRCKTFDAAADGYVRSEGCGVVVLKRLSDARRDGDPILALIRGSAVNQDGRSSGLTAPNGISQQSVIQEALQRARVKPAQVSYIEAHGSGTPLGDPIEIQALGTVFGKDREETASLLIGSVKTNFGHLESAAGIAGLMKLVLALQHKQIPPHLHLQQRNPHIDWSAYPFIDIPCSLTEWQPQDGHRIGGVSSFGFSGTNAHLIVEEFTPPAEQEDGKKVPHQKLPYVLPISAQNKDALRILVQRFYEAFQGTNTDGDVAYWQDVCYTASVRRGHFPYRSAFVGQTWDEVREHMQAFLQGDAAAGWSSGYVVPGGRPPQVAFVFAGQGSQWVQMGRDLLENELVFREKIQACDLALRPYINWSVLKELEADAEHSRLHETDVAQIVLFAVQVALAAFWQARGVRPEVIIGHSAGEVAAAYVAGAIDLNAAARIAAHRGRVTQKMHGKGRMLTVGLSRAEAEELIRDDQDTISLAAINSSNSVVLSGASAAIARIHELLVSRDVFCRMVDVEYASHSYQMEQVQHDLYSAIGPIETRRPAIPIISTITGTFKRDGKFDAEYWMRNIRQTVLFTDALHTAAEYGCDTFIEVGPHPLLVTPILRYFEDVEQDPEREILALPTLRRDHPSYVTFLQSLSALYTHGYPINWTELYPDKGRCIQLPNYPWQHQRYWVEAKRTLPALQHLRPGDHPLLGVQCYIAGRPGMQLWQAGISLESHPYLKHHRVQDAVVFPGAGYVEMALAAASRTAQHNEWKLEELDFERMFVLPEQEVRFVQMEMVGEQANSDELSFTIFGSQTGNLTADSAWTHLVRGMIALSPQEKEAVVFDLEAFRKQAQASGTGIEIYQLMDQHGLHYGPDFQVIAQFWQKPGEALAKLELAVEEQEAKPYVIHPTLLDGCFQLIAVTLGKSKQENKNGFLPVHIEQLTYYARPSASMWAHARVREATDAEVIGDIMLYDQDGHIALSIKGLHLRPMVAGATATRSSEQKNWLHECIWQAQERPDDAQDLNVLVNEGPGVWLILADTRGVAQSLKLLLETHDEQCILVYAADTYAKRADDVYQINPGSAADMARLLAEIQETAEVPLHGFVHLWGLDIATPEQVSHLTLQVAQNLGVVSITYLVQALTALEGLEQEAFPRLWLVTSGAMIVQGDSAPVEVAQSPIWGLGRTIAQEQTELGCVLVDVSKHVTHDEIELLKEMLITSETEGQIVLRDDKRYVARIHTFEPQQNLIEISDVMSPAGERAFRLESHEPGVLDNLRLRETARRTPGPGEVEIQVQATGLNFIEVLKAMGIYPGQEAGGVVLGGECAGVVSAIGEGVNDVHVGDEVIAIGYGAFGPCTLAPAQFVTTKPADLTFAQAAAIPIVFMTAYYSLCDLGRLRKGERVLIHSAAGGTGLAAVQLAQWLGAEIYATAGTPEKREFLKGLGIQHVMDSRTLDFATEIMCLTNGRGVDVVLNSLTGEAARKSLEILAPYGRFLEISKKDIYDNQRLALQPFRKSLSFSAVDLAGMAFEQPERFAELLRTVVQLYRDHVLAPLPVREFAITDAVEAFRFMAQARHIGKIVITEPAEPERKNIPIAPAVQTMPLRDDASYLIIGGLGDIGLEVARWMVQHGARHLVLSNRRLPDASRQAALDELRAQARVLVRAVDVSDQQQVEQLIAEIQSQHPPLKGIVHSAAVLDDATLMHLNQERFERVAAPKIYGAWNLHRATRALQLDFFVLFSSIASVFGSPGQGNYAAANAFLDSLAHYRRQQGLTAMSMNWGPWAQIGLAAAQENRGARLASSGIAEIEPERGIAFFEQLLLQPVPQVVIASLQQDVLASLLSDRIEQETVEQASVQANGTDAKAQKSAIIVRLHATAPQERRHALEQYLLEQVARVLKLTPGQIDVRAPLSSMGLDSLMAVELKNRLEPHLGVTLSTTLVWKYPTIVALTSYLIDKLGFVEDEEASVDVTTSDANDVEQSIADVDQLTDEEAEALLLSSLADIEERI